MGKCILICAGDLTLGGLNVAEDDFVIAVDGGLSYCEVLEVEPDLIIGDFDSLNDNEQTAVHLLQREYPEKVMEYPSEKDDTDTMAAIKEGLRRGFTEFRLYAATGGRFDHTLANIQSLLYLKNHGANGYMVDGTGMMLILKDESISLQKGLEGTLSLFSLVEESRGVTIRGMKYQLENAVIRNDFPVGISNEFVGEQAEIIVEDGTLVCMISYAE